MFRRFLLIALTLALFSVWPATSMQVLAGQGQALTVEQVVETTIAVNGGRQGLAQVRRNGDEHGKITRTNSDGRTEDVTYERRFIRGETSDKDKVRFDQKTPTIEYALVSDDRKTWGLINGSVFTPREDATNEFLSEMTHGIDALLRYKENGSTVALAGKDKQKNVEFYMVDLTDKENHKTRYYISAKFFRVLWLEYEQEPAGGGKPVKFERRFYDYHVAQATLVPYKSVLSADGKPVSECHLLNVTFGVRLDETLFQNPDAQTSSAAP